MINLIHEVKDFILYLIYLGYSAWGYAIIVIGLFLAIMIYNYIGYTAKIIRGSKKISKFFMAKGWIDNSNLSMFLMKCIKHYPYVLRASFLLFTSQDKPLTDFINDKSFNSRDYAIREKAIKYIYDSVVFIGALLSFVSLFKAWGIFEASKVIGLLVIVAIICRYIIMGSILIREIAAKKLFIKAVDLMANGIFIVDKSNEIDDKNNNKELHYDINENKPLENSDIFIERTAVAEGEIIDKKQPEILKAVVKQTH